MTRKSPINEAQFSNMHSIVRPLGDPGRGEYIESMEHEGQKQLLESAVLPTKMNRFTDGQAKFLELGFTFGELVPGDPLFIEATLPEGWKREGSEHNMWSYLVDERGIRRVAIFYKAAYYDRDAFMDTIGVGSTYARTVIYGDEDEPEVPFDLFTVDEAQDFLDTLRNFIAEADEEWATKSMKERVPRVQEWLARRVSGS